MCHASPGAAGMGGDPGAGTRPLAAHGRAAWLLLSLSRAFTLTPLVPATGIRPHIAERKIKLRGFA